MLYKTSKMAARVPDCGAREAVWERDQAAQMHLYAYTTLMHKRAPYFRSHQVSPDSNIVLDLLQLIVFVVFQFILQS
jgi:hypothetical protein